MTKKILLTSVCRPLGPEYGDAPSVGYELLYKQVLRAQGIFSPRTVNIHFGLEYIAENLDAHYMYSHQNRLLTNSLTHNTVGATLMFSRQSLVEGNLVFANRRHGMVFKQLDNSRILNNVIAGQNRGLFVQQANRNRFAGNVIATNDIGLYLSNCSEENVFVANVFVRNTDQVWQPPFEMEQGRKSPNAFSENGGGNYWSDYVGADRNQDGIGDTPYHETDVFGYIVDRHPEARVFALSPAVALLRKGEELMPLLDTTGVTDLAPLMNPPSRLAAGMPPEPISQVGRAELPLRPNLNSTSAAMLFSLMTASVAALAGLKWAKRQLCPTCL